MSTKKFKIYKLLYNQTIIYVGLTRLSLNRRKSAKNYSVPNEIYKKCTIELIEETEYQDRERYWINYYIDLGYSLYNKREGNFKSKEESYEFRRQKQKLRYIKKNKPKMTKEEKNAKRKIRYEAKKDIINEKRRAKYNSVRLGIIERKTI